MPGQTAFPRAAGGGRCSLQQHAATVPDFACCWALWGLWAPCLAEALRGYDVPQPGSIQPWLDMTPVSSASHQRASLARPCARST